MPLVTGKRRAVLIHAVTMKKKIDQMTDSPFNLWFKRVQDYSLLTLNRACASSTAI